MFLFLYINNRIKESVLATYSDYVHASLFFHRKRADNNMEFHKYVMIFPVDPFSPNWSTFALDNQPPFLVNGLASFHGLYHCPYRSRTLHRDRYIHCIDGSRHWTKGSCQRPVFSLGVSQNMHKITNLWKRGLIWSLKLQDSNERKTPFMHNNVCAILETQSPQLKSFNIWLRNYFFPQKLCNFRGSHFSQF